MNKKHLSSARPAGRSMLAALAARRPPSKEELKLQLPKPMFIGTPTNIKSPNLEVITGKSRGPFYVPVGTKLLSLESPGQVERHAAGDRRADHGDRRREGGRRRLLRRAGARQAVGPDRSRRLVRAPRHPRLALPQPGPRLPRRRRPGLGRQGLPEGRGHGLQQRPRQHGRPRHREGQGVRRGGGGPADRSRRARRDATCGSTPAATRPTT